MWRPCNHEVDEGRAVCEGNQHQFIGMQDGRTARQYGPPSPRLDERDHAGADRSCSPYPRGKARFRAKRDPLVKGDRRVIAATQNKSFVSQFAYKNAALLCQRMTFEHCRIESVRMEKFET